MLPYTYDLPPERIAQRPVHPADSARMLVLDRASAEITSSCFSNLPQFLTAKDLLVFNDTRVIPARFLGTFSDNQGEVELLLVRQTGPDRWRCLGRPLRRFRKGRIIKLGGELTATVEERVGDKEVEVSFDAASGDLRDAMQETGLMPIPPYIRGGRSDSTDRRDYQTIFAQREGSIAAPTASLHFNEALMQRIEVAGCQVAFLTLHVGTASFLPLDYDEASGFAPPGQEQFFVPARVLEKIRETKALGGRVIGVGTTVVRALETAVREEILRFPLRQGYGGQAPQDDKWDAHDKWNSQDDNGVELNNDAQRNNDVQGDRRNCHPALSSARRGKIPGATELERSRPEQREGSHTSLFITPGFQFLAIDSLITNFHQPGTTHLLLVEALIGREMLGCAYQFALGNDYRFLSYGDGMLIL